MRRDHFVFVTLRFRLPIISLCSQLFNKFSEQILKNLIIVFEFSLFAIPLQNEKRTLIRYTFKDNVCHDWKLYEVATIVLF